MSWSCICPLADQVGRPPLGLGHPVHPVPRPSTPASSSCLHPNLWALWVHSLSAQLLAPTPSYSPASLTWSSARFRPTGSNLWAHPFGRVLQIGFNDDTGQIVVMKWRAQSDKRHVKVQLAPLVPFSVFSLPFFPPWSTQFLPYCAFDPPPWTSHWEYCTLPLCLSEQPVRPAPFFCFSFSPYSYLCASGPTLTSQEEMLILSSASVLNAVSSLFAGPRWTTRRQRVIGTVCLSNYTQILWEGANKWIVLLSLIS